MSDNKKYYYLKLKENFFESEEIKILENMDNGYKYSNLLLKLYLKSLKHDGALRLNEYIPYDFKMIAAVTTMDIDTVRVGMDIFKNLKLIEILEDGTIYMLQIQNFIGESSTEADRKREYRTKIEGEKMKALPPGTTCGEKSGQMSDISPPEIEKEIEKEIELELEIELEKKISYKDILEAWNKLPPPIKSVKNMTDKRKNKIKTRAKSLNLNTTDILQAIENINHSQFCKGVNNRTWIIDFDWLFKEDTCFTKVLEGKYLDKDLEKVTSKKTNHFNDYKGQVEYNSSEIKELEEEFLNKGSESHESDELKIKIISLSKQGLSIKQIAENLSINSKLAEILLEGD